MSAEETLKQVHSILFAYGDKNDITAHPYWAIVKNGRMGPETILAAPFFSREAAMNHRNARIYEYGQKSYVYCFSGHWSSQYKELREIVKQAVKP